MNSIINLKNNYYFSIEKNISNMQEVVADIKDIEYSKILKNGILLLKIDFATIAKSEYKKVLKKLLHIRNKLLKTTTKIGQENNSKIFLGKLVNYNNTKEQNDFISALNAIFYPTKYERYNYIYDTVCDYLDSFFYGKNLCDFKNNQCGEKKGTTSYIGCCHHYKNKLLGPLLPNNLIPCEYLKEDHTCGAKCIGCKLFTCDYLEKKGIKFRIKDILLLDVFFNPIQKYFIKCMVFTPKDKIMKRLMRLSI